MYAYATEAAKSESSAFRELCFEGQLRVEHIDTKLNSSDLLTKPLPLPTFMMHRKRLMNLE